MLRPSVGQGLLEVIIAIGVIMTGIISVIALTVSNLTNTREVALRYQAVNLAREGLELVRNRRDTNWLSGQANAWEGLPLNTVQALQYDPQNPAGVDFVPEELSEARRICRRADGSFVQNSGDCLQATPFSRVIKIRTKNCAELFAPEVCQRVERPSEPTALEVSATVSWEVSGKTGSLTLEETLYDWR